MEAPTVVPADAPAPPVIPQLNNPKNSTNLKVQVVGGGEETKFVTLKDVRPGETHVIDAAMQRQLFPKSKDPSTIIGPVSRISLSGFAHNNSGAPMTVNVKGVSTDNAHHNVLENTRVTNNQKPTNSKISAKHHIVIPATPYLPNSGTGEHTVHTHNSVSLPSTTQHLEEEVKHRYRWGGCPDLDSMQMGVIRGNVSCKTPAPNGQVVEEHPWIVPTHIPDMNGVKKAHPLADIVADYERQTGEKFMRGNGPFPGMAPCPQNVTGNIYVPNSAYTTINSALMEDVFNPEKDARKDISLEFGSIGTPTTKEASTVTLALHAPKATFTVGKR